MNLRVALELGRVSNLPTVFTNVLAGACLAAAADPYGHLPGAPALGLLGLTLSLFYTGGMFLNDAFDRHYDAEHRPDRPIPSRRAKPLEVFAWGYGMLGAGLFLLALAPLWARPHVGWAPFASGAVLAGLIVFYNAHHKKNPLSPLVMGLCRVFVYITSAASVGSPMGGEVLLGAALLLSYLIGLSYVARNEGLREIKRLWPLVFLLVPFVFAAPRALRDPASALLYVGFLGWVIRALALLRRRAQKSDIPRAVVSLIAGISLLDGVLVASQGRPLLAGACVLGFFAARFLQRYISGT
ncbi:MAG TPA: UbiA family prenyltransferase [Polyangiaceae bacterium]|jgi:4-hydroxybenzoate polyprenyltransferase|nr:UbiA family prenyltransferase [Polyangiaceae bacterium]